MENVKEYCHYVWHTLGRRSKKSISKQEAKRRGKRSVFLDEEHSKQREHLMETPAIYPATDINKGNMEEAEDGPSTSLRLFMAQITWEKFLNLTRSY